MPQNKNLDMLPGMAGRLLLLFTALGKQLLRLSDEALDSVDLSLPQFEILRILWRHDRLTLGELSRLCCCAPPNITGLVDRLEHKGLVKRQPDPEDRRALRVCLTEAGQALAEPALAALDKLVSTLMEALTPAEAAQITELLGKLHRHLGGMEESWADLTLFTSGPSCRC